ncbi:MAG: ferrous iron transport protein B [Selenomonadaceae bacterium]|nr:ferrous iron transport protein B [Selenomonadaceae bacterium]
MATLSVALTGNPNTGKSTIFNELTGARQKIGNWPGVTVDKKVGVIEHNGRKISVIDLPGTYSINARSQEEQVVSDFFKQNKPDIVVNIIDASNIARNLFLTIQLMENGIPLILNLNMMDEAQRHGIKIDMKKLESAFGMPVTNTVGRSNKSVRKLLDVFTNAVMSNYKPSELITEHIEKVRNIERSGLAAAKVEEEIIAARYDLIDKIMAQAVTVSAAGKTLTEKLDSYLANGVSSLLLMVAIFYLMFQISFNWIGQPLADLVGEFFDETLVPWAAESMESAGVADWMQSLVSDGIIAGVGAVINFVPLIFTLFIILSFLDGTGYMARVAFIMDPIMRRAGLTGKSIMPLVMGFGCGVPAIMANRALDTHKDRMISIFVTPFITCNAKVPIIALFAAMFFPDNVANVVFAMYLAGILTAIVMAKVLSKTMFKEQESTFLLELPPYRLPDPKTVLLEAWDKGKGYLIKAGTIIFAMSVLIWFLSSFNSDGMTEDMNESYLASIGSATSVIFAPQGFNTWEAGAAVVTGILAKEAVVSTIGILYGADEDAISTDSEEEANETAQTLLATSMGGAFTPLSALAFMVFSLLYSPCMTALGTVKKEAQGFKWMAFVFFYTTAVAWVISLIVYQGGKLLGFE